jgi:predicted nucleic acid-binding Zn ribbon protein
MSQGAVHIQHILKDVIKDIGGKKRLKRQGQLEGLWEEVVGKDLAQHTYVLGVKQKVIQVKVDSAPLLNELANFKKQSILTMIRKKLPDKSSQSRRSGIPNQMNPIVSGDIVGINFMA